MGGPRVRGRVKDQPGQYLGLLQDNGQVAVKDPTAAAIGEIKQQLRVQGGRARVRVEGWQERFGGVLGSLRDFLESRPDKFLVEQDGGRNFVVSEVEGGRKRRKGAEEGQQQQQQQFWEEEGEEAMMAAPAAKRRRKAGGADEAAVPPAAALGPAKNPVASAIQDIKQQLNEQGGAGKVWIENWRERYGELGTLQQFLESRPDKFTLTKQRKGGFMVALVGLQGSTGGGKGGNAGGGKGTAMMAIGNGPQVEKGGGKGGKGGKRFEWPVEVDNRDYAGAAIGEIKMQLKEQGGEGNVWVEDWGNRYAPALGSLRQFLESRPDKFAVSAQGKRFTVAIVGAAAVGGGKGKGKGSKAGGAQQPAALALTNAGGGGGAPNGGKGKDRGKGEGKGGSKNPVAEAIKEIRAQLREQGGHGKVKIDGWKDRFAPSLGSIVEFLEARQDKFTMHAAGRQGFTVSLPGAGAGQNGAGAADSGQKAARRKAAAAAAKGGGRGKNGVKEGGAKPTQFRRLWGGATTSARKASARNANRSAAAGVAAGGAAAAAGGKRKGKGGGKGGWGSGGGGPGGGENAGKRKVRGPRRAGGKGAWS